MHQHHGRTAPFERPAHGLHRLAGHALDALHACPQLGADPFVQAVNIAVVIASVFLGFGLWLAGLMSAPELSLSVMAIAPALLGVHLGNWARRHIPASQFKSIVLAVLLLIGFSLALRA